MSNETDQDPDLKFDTPAEIIIAAGPEKVAGLVVDPVRFKTWLHENFAVLEWARIETPQPHYEFAIDFPLDNDPAFQIEGLIYEDGRKGIAFGRATPRFAAAFLHAFVEHFPENTDVITVVDDRICARFDASRDDDDAMLQMLAHDEALAQTMGGTD
ncbi:MAG: hypothetical protein Q7T86_12805 [Hyphomicrobiaceae bacterium]|nr:hypothetical protein [Hyphomicrobiaceae bacterium]